MRRKDRAIVDRPGLEDMLARADTCRLAFAVGGEPYIVALSYGFSWEGELPVLYFHGAREGRKLDSMRANPRVCFQLDLDHEILTGPDPCDWGTRYGSIVGWGELRETEGDAARIDALCAINRHYGWSGEPVFKPGMLAATSVLELRVSEMTGKRKS